MLLLLVMNIWLCFMIAENKMIVFSAQHIVESEERFEFINEQLMSPDNVCKLLKASKKFFVS